MPQVVIKNPILNSPFREPSRHFLFDDDGITNRIGDGRRRSAYFLPIARPRTKDRGTLFETWTKEREKPNDDVNAIRDRVSLWRAQGWPHVTATTRRLLQYWTRPDREKRLFFCQVEAVETAIYVTEVAGRTGDAWIANKIREWNERDNDGLPRVAFKMATGTGKTVVMAMLIAWHALNKKADPKDKRFADAFLVVTPGITIRDRLRVLRPNDPENYYRERDVLSPEDLARLEGLPLVITNFHAFLPHDNGDASRLTKSMIAKDGTSPFVETPDAVARRVCRDLGRKGGILVINDEAHHCYRRRPDEVPDPAASADGAGPRERLSREEKSEADRREKDARVWFNGLKAIAGHKRIGIRAVYDLSATPFFLRGSGYSEGTLFPWVVSDFSLIDAIESGIVKVPRVPVEDDKNPGESPTYRELWLSIRDQLPRHGRGAYEESAEPRLPTDLQSALLSLYGNYKKQRERFEQSDAKARGQSPPVFIVVCSNTAVSRDVYRWIAGYERPAPPSGDEKPADSPVVVPGALDLFSNVRDGQFIASPNTILVDSEELESGEGMSPEFKKIAAREIEDFKHEFRVRTSRDPEELSDEDILREVMNTVGKRGKLGEKVACVVSVSMLTEGWDANTVTHVLGVRAFGTQLLCEQVVGRALRRMSYPVGADMFPVEYAEIYGVPFSFIPTSGHQADPVPGPDVTHVRALPEREAMEITFPRVIGYRFEVDDARLSAKFEVASHLSLSSQDVATWTDSAPIAGETERHDLSELRKRRWGEIAFRLAARVVEEKFERKSGEGERDRRPWYFPQVLAITRRWIAECVHKKDGGFEQMLLLPRPMHDAVERIHGAIVRGSEREKRLRAILAPYDTVGSTRWVDFDTTKPVYLTRAKSHVSHVPLDSKWEAKAAQSLEEMPEVLRYVKNQRLGFEIPYTIDGEEHRFLPDYLVVLDDGKGAADPLHLIIEVSGELKRDKAAKVHAARTLWVPAVNAHGGLGRWAFLEVVNPWEMQGAIRAAVRSGEFYDAPLLENVAMEPA